MIGKIFRLSFLSMLVLVFFYNPVDCYPQFYKKKTEKKRSFQEIQGEAHRYWENREQDKKPGYKQYKRWEWQTESRLNSDGYTDAGLKWKGWQEKKERFGATAAEAGSNWVSLGPVQRGQIMGLGRINCMAFDPQNNDIIWIGSPTGGLWKSENGGQTWGNLTDHLPNLGVSDIIIHPENSDIIYFATGDKGRASSLSTGVMKSLDGGLTWELTGLNHGLEDQYLINKLGVHKSKTDILLAATNHGIYKTIDAGTTWEKKLDGDFYDLEICTNCSCTWYASKSGDGVYKSTDAGDNWTRLSVGLPAPSSNIGRIALAVCDSSPDSVYAVYSQEFAGIGWEWGLYGIYRSMDGGNTWSLQANSPNMLGWDTTGMDSGGQGGYALVFEVDPEDVDEVYVGSVHLWRSADGGENWLCITGSGGGAAVHVDHHDFAFLPGNPDTMFSANDGGLYKTEHSGI
ncbi:MAG: hypothetical protein GY757_06825, partial [bacterium]|nr:hypothetical protein [bacterium]